MSDYLQRQIHNLHLRVKQLEDGWSQPRMRIMDEGENMAKMHRYLVVVCPTITPSEHLTQQSQLSSYTQLSKPGIHLNVQAISPEEAAKNVTVAPGSLVYVTEYNHVTAYRKPREAALEKVK